MSAGAALRARLTPRTQEASQAFGRALIAAAKREAPVDTGALRGSLSFQQRLGTTTGSISMKYYGRYVLSGTRPHDIPNAFGRGESFGVANGLHGVGLYFHPGTAPNEFIARAMRSPEVAAWRKRLPILLFSARPQ